MVDNNGRRVLSIAVHHLRMLRYDEIMAKIDYKVRISPQEDLKRLGMNVLCEGPPNRDFYIILTDFRGHLPPYIQELALIPGSGYWRKYGVEIID